MFYFSNLTQFYHCCYSNQDYQFSCISIIPILYPLVSMQRSEQVYFCKEGISNLNRYSTHCDILIKDFSEGRVGRDVSEVNFILTFIINLDFLDQTVNYNIMSEVQQTNKKKRKGISVSLSPYKTGERLSQRSKQNTPIKQQIVLQQSYVKAEDFQSYFHNIPRYVQIQPVIKSKQNSANKLKDSSLKHYEQKQKTALDQQLFVLRSQIQNKKKSIQMLSHRQKSNFNPAENCNLTKCTEKDPKSIQIKRKVQLYRQQVPEYQSKSIKLQNKKENNVKDSPTKQMNRKNLTQRIQKLKWAEQKLMDIIKLCDNGV